MKTANGRTLAVIGAGPIGLEAALAAKHLGCDVRIYERGQTAEHVQQWGFVRMFSPFGMNVSLLGRQRLAEQGRRLPESDAILTGEEFRDQYLVPLSELPELKSCIFQGCEIQQVGRSRLFKGDEIGASERRNDPFRLLVCEEGQERWETADFVFDCSGVWRHANWAGPGGLPAIGEQCILQANDYRIPSPERIASDLASSRVLVIGGGYSAATTIVGLAQAHAASSNPGSVHWRTRSSTSLPMVTVPDDPLPERRRLIEQANELARSESNHVDWKPGWVIERMEQTRNATIRVHFLATEPPWVVEVLDVDRIIANVGNRPDRTLTEELQIHECYATHGPMKLAATLLGSGSQDCLTQPTIGPESLFNPEPGYFFLGARSYGRNPHFLLQSGLQQVAQLMGLLSEQQQGSVT